MVDIINYGMHWAYKAIYNALGPHIVGYISQMFPNSGWSHGHYCIFSQKMNNGDMYNIREYMQTNLGEEACNWGLKWRFLELWHCFTHQDNVFTHHCPYSWINRVRATPAKWLSSLKQVQQTAGYVVSRQIICYSNMM